MNVLIINNGFFLQNSSRNQCYLFSQPGGHHIEFVSTNVFNEVCFIN
jgi:hypothetical protein